MPLESPPAVDTTRLPVVSNKQLRARRLVVGVVRHCDRKSSGELGLRAYLHLPGRLQPAVILVKTVLLPPIPDDDVLVIVLVHVDDRDHVIDPRHAIEFLGGPELVGIVVQEDPAAVGSDHELEVLVHVEIAQREGTSLSRAAKIPTAIERAVLTEEEAIEAAVDARDEIDLPVRIDVSERNRGEAAGADALAAKERGAVEPVE